MQRYHDIDNSKSYATEENLEKALFKLFGKDKSKRALIVCNREGRFTAVFPLSAIQDCPNSRDNLALFSRHGFMTLG